MKVAELIKILSDLDLDNSTVYGNNSSIQAVRFSEDEDGRKIVILSEE